MLYRAISNTISHFLVVHVKESLTAKQKDRLLSFLVLNVIEAKIFKHVFLEGQKVWENNRY